MQENINDIAEVNNETILEIVDVINNHKAVKEFKITDDKLIIEFEYELFFMDVEIFNSLLKQVEGYREITKCEFYIDKKSDWKTISLKLI